MSINFFKIFVSLQNFNFSLSYRYALIFSFFSLDIFIFFFFVKLSKTSCFFKAHAILCNHTFHGTSFMFYCDIVNIKWLGGIKLNLKSIYNFITDWRSYVDTLKMSAGLLKSASKVPKGIRTTKQVLDSYKANLKHKDESILQDINDGRSMLAEIKGNLFGLNPNYPRESDGKNALMLGLINHDKLISKLILKNQNDFKNERLHLNLQDKNGNTAIMHAVKNNNQEGVDFLVKYPELLYQNIKRNYFGNTNKLLLSDSAAEKIKEKIKQTCFLDLNHKDNDGKTLLMQASSSPQMLSSILKGAHKHNWNIDFNIKDNNGKTFIDYIKETKDTNIIRVLKDNDIDVPKSVEAECKESTVSYIKNKAKELYDYYYKPYEDLNKKDEFCNEQSYFKEKYDQLNTLANRFLSIYKIVRDKDELFMDSFEKGTLDRMIYINLVDINTKRESDGKNALMIAIDLKDYDKMRWIMKSSSPGNNELDLNLTDNNGNTALMLASKNGYNHGISKIMDYKLWVLKHLCRKFESIKGLEKELTQNKLEMIREEIQSFINIKNKDGKTAMDLAIESKNCSSANLIKAKALELGLDLNLANKDISGETLTTSIAKKDDTKMLSSVLKYTTDKSFLNTINEDGKSPLQIAIENDNYYMVSTLLTNGAKAHICNKDGQNMMDVALKSKADIKIRKLLKSEGVRSSKNITPKNSYKELLNRLEPKCKNKAKPSINKSLT